LLLWLTERTFYGVSTLSGLPIQETIQDCQAVAKDHFRADKVNEHHLEVTPCRVLVVSEVLEVHVVPLSDEVRIVPDVPTATNVLFT
jgi:hypothetical protein